MSTESLVRRVRSAAGRGVSRFYEAASHSSRSRLAQQLDSESHRLSERLEQLEIRLDATLLELAAVRTASEETAGVLAAAVEENRELNRALIDSIAMIGHRIGSDRAAR